MTTPTSDFLKYWHNTGSIFIPDLIEVYHWCIKVGYQDSTAKKLAAEIHREIMFDLSAKESGLELM